jgi:hypothetical protein
MSIITTEMRLEDENKTIGIVLLPKTKVIWL